MKSRWLGVVQVLAAGFAVHALAAACSGGGAAPAVAHAADGTTGGGAGGTGAACSCPEPDVRTVACPAADAGSGVVELDYPGRTAVQLARLVAIGRLIGYNSYESIGLLSISDGKTAINCDSQRYDSATLILPP